MSSSAHAKRDELSSGSIVPFPVRDHPQAADLSTGPSPVLGQLAELEAGMKESIEGLIADIYYRLSISQAAGLDDPFDAIFISRLRPDFLRQADTRKIRALSEIRDISHRISFEDDWED